MLAHNMPRDRGKPLQPSSWTGYYSVIEDLAEIEEGKQKMFLRRYLEKGIKPEYWEMDAGWYINDGHWWTIGTWEPDPKRFPGGLRPLYDFVHARGLKTHIWFELERAMRGTWMWEKHPEWLLTSPEGEKADRRLLNLGDPQAYKWVLDTLDQYINEGIDFYRTDFNIAPLPYWRANDAPDRQGITEIKYVTALLAYFDELLRRHPDLLIDMCASGGRRNDLETLRRGIPITRSDYSLEPVGMQNITYGISLWIPVYGSGTMAVDPYSIRSGWAPRFGFGWDVGNKDLDIDFLRRMFQEWQNSADYLFGDFYPLTPYNSTNSAWMAWQFDRPDLGAGMVQVFRRPESNFESARLKLRGLDPDAEYDLNDVDKSRAVALKGRTLMEEGLPLSMPEAPASTIITYRKR
jgi:alpha-galactosidase